MKPEIPFHIDKFWECWNFNNRRWEWETGKKIKTKWYKKQYKRSIQRYIRMILNNGG